MAKMIPSSSDDYNSSIGEKRVFEALKNGLPNEYTVFHSLHWNRRNNYSKIEWGEADFVVFHRKLGILIIEVKSGGIELKDGIWEYVRTDDGTHHKMKRPPMEQAERNKYAVLDIVSGVLLEGEKCWAEPAVWFPSINRRESIGEMPPTYAPEVVLNEWALTNVKAAVDNAFAYYSMHSNLSEEAADRIVKCLAPEFNAVPSMLGKYHEQEVMFMRLTSEQQSLLDYLDEQPTAAIQGSAGTGKTLLAVEKANRLSESGNVLFLCFNVFLRDKLKAQNKNEAVDYQNLQSLTKQNTKSSGLPNDSDVAYYLNNYDSFGDWKHRHIVIDEGQDFESRHIELLSDIAEINDGAFYVFYDKNQLIQKQILPEWVSNSECRLVLRRNCRNTEMIAATAGRPIELNPCMSIHSPKGNKPTFHLVDDESPSAKIAELIGKYLEAGFPKEQITILSAKTEEDSALFRKDKVGKYKLDTVQKSGTILFSTIRKFKGLESDIIILIDIDSETFCNETARCLFYVGTSRAKHFLEIVSTASNDDLRRMAKNLGVDDTHKGINAKIAERLQVVMKR